MDSRILVVVTIILSWLMWKIVKYIRRYKIIHGIFKSGKLLTLGETHLIKGHVHLFSNYRQFFDILIPKLQTTRKRLFGMWVYYMPIFGVCHPETLKVFMKSSEPKAKHIGTAYNMLIPWLGDGLLLSDGVKWLRNRRLLTPAFHYDILRPYVPIYNQDVDVFLEKISKVADTGSSIDIQEPVALFTLDTMLQCALSYEGHVQERGDSDPYVASIKILTNLIIERLLKPWQFVYPIYKMLPSGQKWTKAVDYIHKFDEDLIRKRRDALTEDSSALEKRRLDFLDILLTAKDENGEGLSDREIRDEVDTFLFEAHDTTASAIFWAIYHLGKYPEEQHKVYDEIQLVMHNKEYMEWSDLQQVPVLTAFIKESMRTIPPVVGTSRVTTDYTEVDGVVIPPNVEVFLMIHLMHHHPDVWEDHEEFRPARFLDPDTSSRHPYSYLPFSAGPRNCIGQVFAMNEIKVLLARLVNRFKIIHDPDHQTEYFPEVITRSVDGITVLFEKR